MQIKKLLRAGFRFLADPNYRTLFWIGRGKYNDLSDKEYLQLLFGANMGYPLNLENPQTFNEKLQWLKLYDRKPAYTMMADKYAVRAYIAEKLGEEYLIPLLGVWDDPEQVDFEALPDRFVLKCNHNSGLGMCICKDKSKLDVEKVKQGLKKGLQQDYFRPGREWPYKNIKRCIIAEQYMESSADDLPDYKFHCFNGEPKFVLVCRDRFKATGLTEDFYSVHWERLPLKRPKLPNAKELSPKPEQLKKMIEMAKILSKDIPFVRVDFYEINGKIYFGELTFFPTSGMAPFEPQEWDKTFGDWIELPKNRRNV